MTPRQRAQERMRKFQGKDASEKPYQQRERNAFGRYRVGRPSNIVKYAKKLGNIAEEEYRALVQTGKLAERIGASPVSAYRNNTETRRMLETAKGFREINGTVVGDVLKKIRDRRLDEIRNNRNLNRVLPVLEAAGIVNQDTGAVDRRAIGESLKKNRLVGGRI